MYDFITALEFLTRMRFTQRTTWSDDNFSKSVPYFPVVGLLIGLIMAVVALVMERLHIPLLLQCTLLIVAEIMIIGGLMYDGYMDTADGVFSARDRQRMLEIMKDSHVGSNAVLAVAVLLLVKLSAYYSCPADYLPKVLIGAFVATRTFMVVYIVNFHYARKEGIGKLFKQYAKPRYTYMAFALCLAILSVLGLKFLAMGITTFVLMLFMAHYLSKTLGGLTGDTYGALTECGMMVFLVVANYLAII